MIFFTFSFALFFFVSWAIENGDVCGEFVFFDEQKSARTVPFIGFHVPKTGGTTLQRTLTGRQKGDQLAPSWPGQRAESQPVIKVGHQPYVRPHQIRRAKPGYLIGTWLRYPVERWRSHFFWWRAFSKGDWCVQGRSHSLVDFVDAQVDILEYYNQLIEGFPAGPSCGGGSFVRLDQSRQRLMSRAQLRDGAHFLMSLICPHGSLENFRLRVREIFRKEFFFVGATERFRETFFLLAKMLGNSTLLDRGYLHQKEVFGAPHSVSSADRRSLGPLATVDTVIWEEARRAMDERWRCGQRLFPDWDEQFDAFVAAQTERDKQDVPADYAGVDKYVVPEFCADPSKRCDEDHPCQSPQASTYGLQLAHKL